MKTQCTLIADARERNVLRHERELESVNLVVKQITTADYVVLSPGGNVLAAIERIPREEFIPAAMNSPGISGAGPR